MVVGARFGAMVRRCRLPVLVAPRVGVLASGLVAIIVSPVWKPPSVLPRGSLALALRRGPH